MKTILLILISLSVVSCNNDTNKVLVENIKPNLVTVGKIVKIKGRVLKNDILAEEGNLLIEGDVLETLEKSFTKLEMDDHTTINLGQKSKINLKDYKLSDAENRIIDINLIIGKVKTHFRKKLEGDKGSLKVTTKMASFGVRGTEFITESSLSGKTKMLLLEGKVILTKKKKDSEEKQEIEIKPLEIVTFEEKSEEITTQTVSEEVIVQAANDEDLNIDIQQIEETSVIENLEPELKQTSGSLTNPNVRNFLFSLEHSSKALPLKQNGKLVYFNEKDLKKLAKNKRGDVVAVDPSLDKGIKEYKVPVIFENGEKVYVSVSEQYLLSLMMESEKLGIQVLNASKDDDLSGRRMPASFKPLDK